MTQAIPYLTVGVDDGTLEGFQTHPTGSPQLVKDGVMPGLLWVKCHGALAMPVPNLLPVHHQPLIDAGTSTREVLKAALAAAGDTGPYQHRSTQAQLLAQALKQQTGIDHLLTATVGAELWQTAGSQLATGIYGRNAISWGYTYQYLLRALTGAHGKEMRSTIAAPGVNLGTARQRNQIFTRDQGTLAQVWARLDKSALGELGLTADDLQAPSKSAGSNRREVLPPRHDGDAPSF